MDRVGHDTDFNELLLLYPGALGGEGGDSFRQAVPFHGSAVGRTLLMSNSEPTAVQAAAVAQDTALSPVVERKLPSAGAIVQEPPAQCSANRSEAAGPGWVEG
jgi:hypothetical protein